MANLIQESRRRSPGLRPPRSLNIGIIRETTASPASKASAA